LPEIQVWFAQVATGVSETRSGPHKTVCVASLQASSPGVRLAHNGSTAWQVPWFDPLRLSQNCPFGHIGPAVHVGGLPPQISVTF
jgi:hypothetical protein